jgi:hypothetical protein
MIKDNSIAFWLINTAETYTTVIWAWLDKPY